MHSYTFLDVFTATPLTGNGLVVVHDADDLDDTAMLAFARETKLSETTFVQSATEDGADYRNRIWTAERELPFAGHPSLGTAFAMARQRGADEASFVQQTPAGLQPIDVSIDAQATAGSASMLQEPAEFGDELDPARPLAAVGLGPGDEHPDLPAQFVSTGVFQLMLPVASDEVLARVDPDYDLIAALLEPLEAVVLYAMHIDADAGTAHARSFGFTAAMGEDPATGSAAGPLMAYAHQRLGLDALTISQGAEIGRPSSLRCSVATERVRVEGDVVVVADGSLVF